MECPLRRRALTSICLVVAALGAQPAHAQERVAEQLDAATRAFEMQDYDKAVERLRPLIASELITDKATLRLSLERLGASYWFTGATDAARLTFGTLLKSWPDHPLDPLYYPQELISFYEAEKERLKELGFIGKAEAATPRETGPRMTLVKTVTERSMPTLGYFMPFGVGQYANDAVGKGTLLAVLQGIGLATNIASWLSIEAMKTPGTNVVSAGDAGRAEIVTILWWIGTGLFAGSYIYSVVDGLVERPPSMEEQRRFELMSPGERSTPPAPPSTTLRIGPGPGIGLGISGTF